MFRPSPEGMKKQEDREGVVVVTCAMKVSTVSVVLGASSLH